MARAATRDLTRLGLVLAPGVVRGRWFGRGALLVVGALAGVAASQLYGLQMARVTTPAAVAGAASGPSPLQQKFDQSQLTLRVAESRSQELERQIGTLVQQLRECQEELTFFRKTRDGKSR